MPIALAPQHGRMDGMGETQKKRPWFQFSLMTAIVMMLTASGLLWLNVKPPYITLEDPEGTCFMWAGWPIASEGSFDPLILDFPAGPNEKNEAKKRFDDAMAQGVFSRYANWWEIDLNFLICSGITIFSGVLCEWLLRRREAKKCPFDRPYVRTVVKLLPRIRYSLRTLLIFTLLAGSGMGLWFRWEPWYLSNILLKDTGLCMPAVDKVCHKFATFGSDTKVHLWDLTTGRELLSSEIEFKERPRRMAFSNDREKLIISYDTVIEVHDLKSMEILARVNYDNYWPSIRLLEDKQSFLAFSASRLLLCNLNGSPQVDLGSHAVVANADYEQQSVSAQKAETLSDFGCLTQNLPVNPVVAVSDDSQWVFTHLPIEAKAQIWNLATLKKIFDLTLPKEVTQLCMAGFSPHASRLAALSNDQKWVICWDMLSGRELAKVKVENTASLGGFLSEKELILHEPAGCRQEALLNLETGKTLLSFPEDTYLSSQFPDGRRLDAFIGTLPLRLAILDKTTTEILFQFPKFSKDNLFYVLYPNTNKEDVWLTNESGEFLAWQRRRPEWWWGVAWLPEFWLTLVFGCAFVWSVWRDRRELPDRAGEAKA